MTRVETTRKMTMMSRNSAIPWIRSFWAILASPDVCAMPLSCESWLLSRKSFLNRHRLSLLRSFRFSLMTKLNWLNCQKEKSWRDICLWHFWRKHLFKLTPKEKQDKEAAATGFPKRKCVSVMFYADVSESERDKQFLMRQIVLQYYIQDLGLQFALPDTN